MPSSKALWQGVALAGLLASASPLCADTPKRVVSMNLCTDQLAMMLAAPGQLVSVSHLASEVQSSSMVEEARAYPANRGQVEQVFLMRPDLVLAGTYTQVSTVDLLRRLGVEVVQVPPATSLAEAVEQIRIVGQVLGQDEKANAVADRFSAEIATARFEGPPRSAAFYYPNGYTTGSGTLANEVVELTGFANIGATSGVTGGGILPLERLVMAGPDLVVTSERYPGASRSEDILLHPALRAVQDAAGVRLSSDADWVCGTPHLMRAIGRMQAARAALGGEE
ncbi:ABC transporter substrate-binding protein [Tabrizicola sp.]|uniref:ABC transporter substrate-binding protein n=1 Tax=Tabrizicola sp. TaxID=2005166 RepID=UPI003D2A23BC